MKVQCQHKRWDAGQSWFWGRGDVSKNPPYVLRMYVVMLAIITVHTLDRSDRSSIPSTVHDLDLPGRMRESPPR